jgi:hypothetical protein
MTSTAAGTTASPSGPGLDRHDGPAAARAFLQRRERRPEAGLRHRLGQDERRRLSERGGGPVGERHDHAPAARDGVEVGADLEDRAVTSCPPIRTRTSSPDRSPHGEVRGHAHAQARGGGVVETEHGLPRRDGLSGVGEPGAHAGVEGGADLGFLDLHVDPRDLRAARGHPASARASVSRASSCAAADRWPRSASAVRAGERQPRQLGIGGERREFRLQRRALRQEGRGIGPREHRPRWTRAPSSARTSVRRPPNSKLTSLAAAASIWPVKRRSTV